jgi:RNA polymerase sigma-70 factor, ECF subfamily
VPERKLIHSALRGDRASQQALFNQIREGLFRVAYRMIGNREDAEEVTLDSFAAALNSLDSFDGRSSFATWCYRIVTNRSLDLIRKRQRRSHYHAEVDEVTLATLRDRSSSSERTLLSHEVQRHLERGLASLSPETRAAIILRDIEGLSYREVSDVLECAQGTVASRLARGRTELARYLEAQGIDATYFSSH